MNATKNQNKLAECIETCLKCQTVCLEELTQHCLEAGGEHTEPKHVKTLINCADICHTSARFMMTDSPFHPLTCGLCAEVCEECAQSCEQMGDMDRCVEACRECAESCRRMAA
jgi:hypothetical protein